MTTKKDRPDDIAAIFLIMIGAFLIMDSLFLHLVYFRYEQISMSWLDPFLNHWMWGVPCVIFGFWSLRNK